MRRVVYLLASFALLASCHSGLGIGGARSAAADSRWRARCDADADCKRTYSHVQAPLVPGERLPGECPADFAVKEGVNEGFMQDGRPRKFIVRVPKDVSTPRPVMVSLTGTVEEETRFSDRHSHLGDLNQSRYGFIVAIPYRDEIQDGRCWHPWYDCANPRSDDEGKDVRFLVNMVKCIGTQFPVDAGRIYVGGISAGGSLTLRTMAFASDFFAGAINASGTWYRGGAGPATPLKTDHMIMITTWGGENDRWPAQNPLTVYAPETKAAATYFNAQDRAIHIACTHGRGHLWPPPSVNDWLLTTLLSAPKGTEKSSFKLASAPPEGLACVMGEYQDH